jgi:SecD/SecF fusion protein
MPAEGDQDASEPAETESDSAQADTPPATEPAETAQEPPAEKPADAKPEPDATGDAADADSAAKPKVRILSQTKLTFDYKINGRTLEAEVINAGQAVGIQLTEDDITIAVPADNPDWTIDDSIGYKSWNISVASEQADAEKIFEQMKTKMVETPVWSSSSKIGGKVAGDTRTKAVYALFFSLLCIVIYIWVRFQRVIYGLAAVVALVHDVLITLGAIAISYWLAGFLGFLQIEEFKISLPVVAAFMTIIGYSLNDTIVVFDRIREVRGKSPDLTEGMINTSINQTLSRTLLTSLTTFLVVIILYFLGGAGIHGFAFSLVVGVIVGTYSSVFVASPFLLWMSGTTKTAQQK